jgi:uncharacterized protein
METATPESIRAALRSWRKRSESLASDRDPLVISALAAGITKEEVHQSTGLGRSTIDRIAAKVQEEAE